MNRLPPNFFCWFPVKGVPYEPIYMNLRYLSTWNNELRFISKLNTQNELNAIEKYQAALVEPIDKHFDYQDVLSNLKNLFLSPKSLPSTYASNERNGFIEPESIWVCTERFFWNYPLMNQGSSRHMLLKGIQLKGSGRNPLASRIDKTHAWGGQYLWEGLKAIAFSAVYEKFLPLGIAETISLAAESDEYSTKENEITFLNVTTMRMQNAPRVVQIMTDFDPYLGEKEAFANYWKYKLGSEFDSKNILLQYGLMFCSGITNLNITKDNVVLDGSLIDYEDVSFRGNQENQTFALKILAPANLKEIKSILTEGLLYTSTLHLYLDAIQITELGWKKFFDIDLGFTQNKELIKIIYLLYENIFIKDDQYLEFITSISEIEACYKQGLTYNSQFGASTSPLIKFLTNLDFKIELEEESLEQDLRLYSLILTLPRFKWRDSTIEAYYQSIKTLPIGDLTLPLLRIFNLFLKEREAIDLKKGLDISSKLNESLSQNAWFFPYTFNNGEFSLKNENDLNSLLNKFCNTSNFLFQDIYLIDIAYLNGEEFIHKKLSIEEIKNISSLFILKGIILNNDFISNHYIKLGPVLFTQEFTA